jgi:hypothetical protein
VLPNYRNEELFVKSYFPLELLIPHPDLFARHITRQLLFAGKKNKCNLFFIVLVIIVHEPKTSFHYNLLYQMARLHYLDLWFTILPSICVDIIWFELRVRNV